MRVCALVAAALVSVACWATGALAQTQPTDQLSDLLTRQPGQELLTPPPRAFDREGQASLASPPSRNIDQSQPLYLEGDQLIYDTRGNRVVARGNVQIFYNNYSLTADEVVYDQSANTLTANGNVRLTEPNGNVVSAQSYTLTDDFRDGFVQSLSVTTSDDTRISAERAVRRDASVTEFSNAKFTPCKSADDVPPLWCISSASVVHDQTAATITYEDAQFEIFGVPILYLPYFQHPDPSVKRRSGFLLPEQGSSSNLGYYVEVPYYLALAPNYDLLLRPRYTTKQGLLMQADWRHRLSAGQYAIKLAGLYQDDTDERIVQSGLAKEFRGSVETQGRFDLGSWWTLGWNVTVESDDSFRRFYGLDNILQTDRVNNVYLTGLSGRNYMGVNFYHFGGLLLRDTPEAESRVHPVVDHNYVFDDPVLGGELSVDTNVLSFSREDGINNRQRTDINRISTEVKWRRTLTDAIGITYTPFANLRGDAYQLSNFIDPKTGQIVDDETITRGMAAAGATVSYPWAATSASGVHIIEPIGQIIARQASVQQERLPNEDAKSLNFDVTNLFEVDKFSGLDRIETGTRANAGLQYTFQRNSGGYASLLVGQSFHLSGTNAYEAPGLDADRRFIFNPSSGLETRKSDYVAGFAWAPSAAFRIISQSRFDESDLTLKREDAYARLSLGPLAAQAAYAYTAADPLLGIKTSQQDIYGSLGLQLTDRWSLLGSMRFDIDAEERIQDSLSLRYADECFVLTASYVETFINDPDRDIRPDRAVMFRFELKHLGEFRYRTDVLDGAFGENQPPKP